MRALHRRVSPLLAGVLAAGLGGCASETEQYCDELKDQKQTLTDLAARSDDPDGKALDETVEVFRELQQAAPGDIEDEWQVVAIAYETLADAFGAAGTTPGEYDPTSPPEGISDADRRQIEGAAGELASPRVVEAATGIEQHARDVCKVDLGLSSGGQ